MALRLTGTDVVPDITEQMPLAAAPTAVTLGVRARALLGAGDANGYRRLFAETAELSDGQQRYQARVTLLEHGLTAARTASSVQAVGTFAAVASAALDVLDGAPSEPLVLNYAGIACYELFGLEAAQLLFAAARRLDPGLARIDANLDHVAERRRGGRPVRPLHPIVPTLVRRARVIAGRAQPAVGLTLSLCMIVRDEAQMLPRCLAAAAPAVDEIVIVDTGSQDATVEIARSFGAQVIQRPWDGSFSNARNASFAAATGDWLLYLDADEVLCEQDIPQLRALTGHTWREAYSLLETSFTGELGDGAAVTHNALRMFRNRSHYRFTGEIHEQIAPSLPTGVPGRIGHAAVRVEHYGYLGSVRAAKEKFARNLGLLRQQAANHPQDPFVAFNLGCEYAAAGFTGSAQEEYERAWALLSRDGNPRSCEYAPALLAGLVRTLRATERATEALQRAADGLELYPDFTDLVLEQAATWKALGDTEKAVALYHRCLELGDASARYGSMVGCGTYLPRLALARLSLEQGEIETARELLDWCLEHHPGFLSVAGPYAAAQLAAGVAAEDVVGELERRLDRVTPPVRHALARALRAAGAIRAAREQYHAALAADPDNVAARVGLAELELRQGAYAEAARHSAMVEPGDGYGALACRLELCGRIAGGELQAAAGVLAGADRARVPPAERTLFEAWMTLATGGAPRDGLSTASVPMLATLLELLLEAGNITGFNQLTRLLERSTLAVREQRELLADLEVRHGRLAEAAQHWMAVCADAPDARALIGLARIAATQGLSEDARTFAAGALELDPACDAARELLARLPTAVGAAPD